MLINGENLKKLLRLPSSASKGCIEAEIKRLIAIADASKSAKPAHVNRQKTKLKKS